MSNERLGASIAEWQWAITTFDGGQDILPSVGDPRMLVKRHRKIKDTVKSLAKIPSSIDGNGMCYRISDWANRQRLTTREQLEHWAAIPELNILLLTRNTRVIDIDVEDEATAQGLEDYIQDAFGVTLPVRYRSDSAKRSILIRIDPHTPLNKRIIKLGESDHKIEFLADGQQTLLFGTHPSGARMQLRGHENGIPVVPFERMELLWDTLRGHYNPKAKKFYDIKENVDRERMISSGAVTQDRALEYLIENGHVVGFDSAEKAIVRCPWEHEHTTNDSETATIWAVKREDRDGYFKCLHGHCDGRNTQDFLQEVGFLDHAAKEDFEETTFHLTHTTVAVSPNEPEVYGDEEPELRQAISRAVVAPLPGLGFLRHKKTGEITKTISNLNEILRSDPTVIHAQYDSFTAQMTARIGASKHYAPVDDDSLTVVREIVERRYGVSFTSADASAAISLAAKSNTYDSATAWLEQQQWDGFPRVEFFSRDILKAVDTEYSRAVAKYLWASLAARVLLPGAKADMSLVLVSPTQGNGKSSVVEALSPFGEWYSLVDLSVRDDDTSRIIRGRAVLELAELRGLSNRDAESVKAWMTRTEETWVPKFKEFSTTYSRRCVFVGTTNNARFLRDPTGNRRWLPIRVALTDTFLDSPTLKANIAQYWAEAKAMVSVSGNVQKDLDCYAKAANNLGEPARLAATILDEKYDEAKAWLNLQPDGGTVTVTALRDALRMTGNYDSSRAMSMLRMLGWEEVDGTSSWIRSEVSKIII
jgi:hypothetical protein